MLKTKKSIKIGKDVKSMRQFFQGLVTINYLAAFSYAVDKEKAVRNGNIITTIKTLSVTLTPIRELDATEDESQYFVKDAKTSALYFLSLKHDWSAFYDDNEDLQTEYNHCTLERLVANPDLTKIRHSWAVGTYVPEELITAQLRISYNKEWCKTKVESISQELEISGAADSLFEKV